MGASFDKAGQGASAFRAFLRSLPDDVARAREDGLPVVLRVDRPLPVHSARLMDTLGVEVVVMPAHQALASKDCLLPGCPNAADTRSDYCRHHLDLAPEPDERPSGERGWSRRPKTRADVIESIQRYVREHGHVPSHADLKGSGYVSTGAAARLFGTWSDAVVAAGFARPTGVRGDAWTQERAIARLREVVAELGYVPVCDDKSKYGLPGQSAITRLFGSWAAYVEAAVAERPTHGRRLQAVSPEREPQEEEPAAAVPDTPSAPVEKGPLAPSRSDDAALGLTFEQLIAAGRTMDAIATALHSLEKTERRVVWAFLQPLIGEALDA